MKLSICMMVKNEESNLERCLNSLKNLRSKITNELIIVDTGSTDRTMEIAKLYDVKLYEHKWNNNFSEMRNISISYAKGEWLMIIDADEELVEDKALIKQLGQDNKGVNAIALELENIITSKGKKGSKIVTMRLFRNDGKFHYNGVVHNMPAVEGTVIKVDALLNHYGYIADDDELMETKFERTSKLLMQELEKDPQNIYYLYQLGTTYDMHNEDDKALEFYKKAYEIIKNEPLLNKEHFYLYGSYAKILVLSQQYKEAVRISNEGLLIQEDYIDLMYFGGLSNIILKNYDEGIKLVKNYLNYIDGVSDTSIFNNPNVQLYTINAKDEVLVNLATAYLALKNFDESIKISAELLKKLDENSEYYEKCVNNYIASCIESENYHLLNDLYETISKTRWDNVDVMIYVVLKNNVKIDLASRNHIMSQLPSYLGAQFKMHFTSELGKNNPDNLDIQKNMYFVNNGIYEVVLFALQTKIQCEELFVSINEMELMKSFSELIDQYETEVSKLLLERLETLDDCKTFSDYYLRRVILKVLAMNTFYTISEDNYFEMYIDAGLEQLVQKYTNSFLVNNVGKQYLNSEEQYFACLYNLRKNFDKNYVYYALEIFPEYSRKTLNWIEKKVENVPSNIDNESSDLVEKIKLNIQTLIESDRNEDAVSLINAYLEIYPNDIEMIILKTELVLLN
ncbi:glycosyltransferase [Fusibacter bizertensis]